MRPDERPGGPVHGRGLRDETRGGGGRPWRRDDAEEEKKKAITVPSRASRVSSNRYAFRKQRAHESPHARDLYDLYGSDDLGALYIVGV